MKKLSHVFEEAIKLDPKNPKLHGGIKGITFVQQGKYEEAIPCYEEAIKLDPENSRMHGITKAVALLRSRKRTEEALACFEEAIKLDPEYTVL